MQPKWAACFDLSQDDKAHTYGKQEASDMLGRDLFHGDLIKFTNKYEEKSHLYVINGQDKLLEDCSDVNTGFNVPLKVTSQLSDAINHYRNFTWETMELGPNDVNIKQIFAQAPNHKHDHDILTNGRFVAFSKYDGDSLVNQEQCREICKFYLHVRYKKCEGMFVYYRRLAVNLEMMEEYFANEIKKKEERDSNNGIVKLTFDHRVSYTVDGCGGGGKFTHVLPFDPKQAFPSDKWTTSVDESTTTRTIVHGFRPELELFSKNFWKLMQIL